MRRLGWRLVGSGLAPRSLEPPQGPSHAPGDPRPDSPGSDDTDARKTTVARFGRSHRSAQRGGVRPAAYLRSQDRTPVGRLVRRTDRRPGAHRKRCCCFRSRQPPSGDSAYSIAPSPIDPATSGKLRSRDGASASSPSRGSSRLFGPIATRSTQGAVRRDAIEAVAGSTSGRAPRILVRSAPADGASPRRSSGAIRPQKPSRANYPDEIGDAARR